MGGFTPRTAPQLSCKNTVAKPHRIRFTLREVTEYQNPALRPVKYCHYVALRLVLKHLMRSATWSCWTKAKELPHHGRSQNCCNIGGVSTLWPLMSGAIREYGHRGNTHSEPPSSSVKAP